MPLRICFIALEIALIPYEMRYLLQDKNKTNGSQHAFDDPGRNIISQYTGF